MAASRDIVVIGAGIIGCAVAYELGRRGAAVTVMDDRAPGMGATQASAGVLAPFIEARDEGPLLELTARSLGLFDEFIARVKADSHSAVHYKRTGTLDVALDADAFARLQQAERRLLAQHIQAELVDAAATRRAEPHLTSSVTGGLLIPGHGFVAATELTHALAAAAQRSGAVFVNGGRARRVFREGSRLEVEFENADCRRSADVVVLAAGSWAGMLDIEGVQDVIPVRPVRGQLLHLQWSGPPLRRIIWSDRCYVVPWDDGTVLVGATEEEAGFEERTTLAGIQDLIGAACELLPHAWTASLLAAKVGLRPASPDHLPLIGWSTAIPNLMYATGHYRNGILLAPLTAELVATAVLERRADPMLGLTRPQRFGAL